MAKPGGKADSKRKDRRAEKAKDKARAKPDTGRRAASKPASAKPKPVKAESAKSGSARAASVKAKRPKGAQRLVEQVAAEIVTAELERAVSEMAESAEAQSGAAVTSEAAVEQATTQEPATAEPAKPAARRRKGAASSAAVTSEAAEAEPESEPESGSEDETVSAGPIGGLLRVAAGAPVDLDAIDTAATPGVSSRAKAEAELPGLALRLEELQERLFAAARGGDSKRRVLLVLQGMDTSGKGGTVRHVVGQLDPNGTRLTAFKAPTEEELAHDFLWRIRNALPVAGEVGIFDRSHYEDVLIARVRKLALPMNIGRRYQLINKFEQGLAADGAVLVKCFLHISPQTQKERLLARLDDPSKLWKYNPTDVDERLLWPQYQEAYRLALEKCSTEAAPWHVIPADRKWYRNYAITRLLVEALEGIDPQYPPGGFDVEVERKRVLAS